MRSLIILCVLVLASCTKTEPESAPWESWGEPGLTLVTPGKAPLRKLRRTFKRGRKATIDVQLKGGADVKALSLSYVLSLETIEVSEDGAKATVELRVDEPAVFRGVRGQYTADALGGIADLEIQPPSGADAQAQSSIRGLARILLPVLAVRLPEEEVGEGAQWSIFETIEDGPVASAVRTIYELTKLDGSKVEVGLTFEEAAKQSEPGPMSLVAFQGTGSGAASVDLGKIAPNTAKRETSRKQKVSATSGQVFVMALETTTLLSAR